MWELTSLLVELHEFTLTVKGGLFWKESMKRIFSVFIYELNPPPLVREEGFIEPYLIVHFQIDLAEIPASDEVVLLSPRFFLFS